MVEVRISMNINDDCEKSCILKGCEDGVIHESRIAIDSLFETLGEYCSKEKFNDLCFYVDKLCKHYIRDKEIYL